LLYINIVSHLAEKTLLEEKNKKVRVFFLTNKYCCAIVLFKLDMCDEEKSTIYSIA